MTGVLLAFTVLLAVFTMGAYQTATAAQTVRAETEAVLDEDPYGDLTLLDTTVDTRESPLNAEVHQVTVTVARPTDQEYPQLAHRIDRRIERRVNRDVETRVRYVDVQAATRN